MDNRRAGQVAAFIAGRTLEQVEAAEVAVVVGYYSYRGHEDREIGFRTTLREYFPHVQLVEVIKGEDSSEAAYEATRGFTSATANHRRDLQRGGRQSGGGGRPPGSATAEAVALYCP